tara:strand:- start:402 stop:635 length:234 start_codon:yes stop_codon:yes gene_type:complete
MANTVVELDWGEMDSPIEVKVNGRFFRLVEVTAKERQSERQKEWYQKMKADPERWAAMQEYRRQQYRARKNGSDEEV